MKKIVINLDLEKISTNQASDLLHVLYRIEDFLEYKCPSVSNSINKIQDYLHKDLED